MNLIRVFVFPHPCLECQYRLGWEQRGCLVVTMLYQYALIVKKDTSVAQSHQGARGLKDQLGNPRAGSCDDTFPLVVQISYVFVFAFGSRCRFILEPLSQITFRVSLTQRLFFILGLISCLGLETISLVWQWAFLGYHVVRWQCFSLLPLRFVR